MRRPRLKPATSCVWDLYPQFSRPLPWGGRQVPFYTCVKKKCGRCCGEDLWHFNTNPKRLGTQSAIMECWTVEQTNTVTKKDLTLFATPSYHENFHISHKAFLFQQQKSSNTSPINIKIPPHLSGSLFWEISHLEYLRISRFQYLKWKLETPRFP